MDNLIFISTFIRSCIMQCYCINFDGEPQYIPLLCVLDSMHIPSKAHALSAWHMPSYEEVFVMFQLCMHPRVDQFNPNINFAKERNAFNSLIGLSI